MTSSQMKISFNGNSMPAAKPTRCDTSRY